MLPEKYAHLIPRGRRAGPLCVLPLVAGCATFMGEVGDMLTSRDAQIHTMTIISTPTEATIMITDEKGDLISKGVTPKTVFLRKKSRDWGWGRKSYQIAISKSGYESQSILVTSTVSPWYLGNLVPGLWMVGFLIVDPMFPYMYDLSPESVVVSLNVENKPMPQDPVSVRVEP